MKNSLKVVVISLLIITSNSFADSVNTTIRHTPDEVHECVNCVGRLIEFKRHLQQRNEQHTFVIRSHKFARFLNTE